MRADIKGEKREREREWSAQSPQRRMNILSGEFYNSVSPHARGHTFYMHPYTVFAQMVAHIGTRKHKKNTNPRCYSIESN